MKGRARILCMAAVLCTTAAVFGFELRTTPAATQTFLGNRAAKLLYAISDGTREGIYFIDLSADPLTPQRICTDMPQGRSLIASPDGSYIVYTLSEHIYVRTLMANSPGGDRRSICDGTMPKWWIHPQTGDTYIIFSRQSDNTGIYCQKLNANYEADGSPTKFFDNEMGGGGRSADGRFLAAHGWRYMWEIDPATATSGATASTAVVFIHQEVGNCYGSMSPSKNATDHHYGCIMHSVGGHEAIGVWKFDPAGKPVRYFDHLGSDAVADSSEPLRWVEIPDDGDLTGFAWITCAWSTHEDYATAIGHMLRTLSENFFNLDLVNLHEEEVHHVLHMSQSSTTLNNAFLWVETSTEQPVRAVFVADPQRGTAPLDVSFDASSSTGEGISYGWRFGDGTTGSGQTTSHRYTSAGSYTVRLIVSNATKADTATDTITVDAAAPTVDRINIVPTSPTRAQYNTVKAFSATAYDSDNTRIPGADITWSVRGNGGGSIEEGADQNATYTAGENIGGVDTVIATSGGVTAKCVVQVIGDPITVTAALDGGTFEVGDTLLITWTTDTLRVSRVNLLLTTDGGDAVLLPISSGGAAINTSDTDLWGSYPWVIPADINGTSTVATTCQIVVQGYDPPQPVAFSRGTFTIVNNTSGVRQYDRAAAKPHCRVAGHAKRLDISLPANESYTIALVDIDGRCLLRRTRAGGSPFTLDLRPYGRGVYVLRVSSRSGMYQTRIVDGF